MANGENKMTKEWVAETCEPLMILVGSGSGKNAGKGTAITHAKAQGARRKKRGTRTTTRNVSAAEVLGTANLRKKGQMRKENHWPLCSNRDFDLSISSFLQHFWFDIQDFPPQKFHRSPGRRHALVTVAA